MKEWLGGTGYDPRVLEQLQGLTDGLNAFCSCLKSVDFMLVQCLMLRQMQQQEGVQSKEATSRFRDMLRRQKPFLCRPRFALHLTSVLRCRSESSRIREVCCPTQVTIERAGDARHVTDVWCLALGSAAATDLFESCDRFQFLPYKCGGLCTESTEDGAFNQSQANDEASQD